MLTIHTSNEEEAVRELRNGGAAKIHTLGFQLVIGEKLGIFGTSTHI